MKYRYLRYSDVIRSQEHRRLFVEQSACVAKSIPDLNHINLTPSSISEVKTLLAHFSFYFKTEECVRLGFMCHGNIAFWGRVDRKDYDSNPVDAQNKLRESYTEHIKQVIQHCQ